MKTSLYYSKRLYKEYISKYFLKILLSLLFMIIVAICNATHAYMIKPALDEIFFNHKHNMLILIPLWVIIIAIIKSICSYFQHYYTRFLGQRIITNLQQDLYNKLINADIEYLHKFSSGKLISRFTNDIAILKNSMTNFVIGIAKELFTVIFLIAVMFSLSPLLSFITFFVFPLAILPIIKLGQRMKKISFNTQEELENYTAKLDDAFKAIKIVKSFNRENFEIKKAKTVIESIFNFYVKAIKTESLSSPIMELLSGLAIALVIWYGGKEVMLGNTSPGTFFAFITAFITAYKPIKSLASLNNNIQEGLAAAKRLFDVLDYKPTIINAIDAKDLIIHKANIKFDNVTYKYDQNTALSKISLDIESGSTIAFVGKSGSGKSTLVNLLMRLYDTNSGTIKIDDQDIKKVNIKSLRENISYVSQDILLFDDSISTNIKYGKLDAKNKELEEVAKVSDIASFINSLDEKYDTLIGQSGYKLSGGQKQKLSIARAILKNSVILILDEATSALDNISEKIIYKNLKKIRENKTTIIIAHRLSTIIDADKIYVFKNGKIVESGTHKDLLNKNGEYLRLYKASLVDES